MGFQPFVIDESITRFGGGRIYLRPSNYLLKLKSIAPSPEDYAKTTYWQWNYEIVDGPESVGRVYSERTFWTPEYQFNNGQMLAGLGFEPAKLISRPVTDYNTFSALTKAVSDKVSGTTVGVYIADGNPSNGRPTSQIAEMYPAAEYQQRKQLVTEGTHTPDSGSVNGQQSVPTDYSAEISRAFSDL